jgi:hypothetical protein
MKTDSVSYEQSVMDDLRASLMVVAVRGEDEQVVAIMEIVALLKSLKLELVN